MPRKTTLAKTEESIALRTLKQGKPEKRRNLSKLLIQPWKNRWLKINQVNWKLWFLKKADEIPNDHRRKQIKYQTIEETEKRAGRSIEILSYCSCCQPDFRWKESENGWQRSYFLPIPSIWSMPVWLLVPKTSHYSYLLSLSLCGW